MVESISELYFLLSGAINSEQDTIAEEKSKQGISQIYPTVKRVKLFHRGYAVLEWLEITSRHLTEVLNLFDGPSSILAELVQDSLAWCCLPFPKRKYRRRKGIEGCGIWS